jgi:hypothetical protein
LGGSACWGAAASVLTGAAAAGFFGAGFAFGLAGADTDIAIPRASIARPNSSGRERARIGRPSIPESPTLRDVATRHTLHDTTQLGRRAADFRLRTPIEALEHPKEGTPPSATGLDSGDDAEEVSASPVHDDSTTTDVPANYVSDAELLAWLQAKSSDQYGDLIELMDASNARSKLEAAYAGTDQAKDIADALAPLRTIVENYVAWQAARHQQPPAEGVPVEEMMEEAEEVAHDLAGSETETETDSESEPAPAPGWPYGGGSSFYEQQLAKSMGKLDATIKDLEHVDQLALIQIQALMSEIRETAQLTSNILANRSQTSDSIVGNLRA